MSEIVRGDRGRKHQTSSSRSEPDEAMDEMDMQDDISLEAKAPRRARWGGRVSLVPLLAGIITLLVLMLVGLTVAYFIARPSAVSRQAARGGGLIPDQLEGQVVKRETFGDWNYVCVKPDNGDVRCSISQQLADAGSNTPIFRWRISKGPDGALIGEWDTPSGVIVGQGIVLDAGWDKPARIPFQACFPEGCQAVAGFDPDAVDRLSKTGKAVVTMFPVDAGSGGVQLVFSVKGLPEALAALK